MELDFVSVKDISYTVWLEDPQGNVEEYAHSPREILVEHPQLWWPRGYGKQPLYTVKVTAFSNGEILDTWQGRIGLRTVTVSREKDAWGESFAHEVNGVKIFAMGADYIPEDNLLSRVTRKGPASCWNSVQRPILIVSAFGAAAAIPATPSLMPAMSWACWFGRT